MTAERPQFGQALITLRPNVWYFKPMGETGLKPGGRRRFPKVIQGASDGHLPVAMAGVCSPILAE
jgi:hypothetical protein